MDRTADDDIMGWMVGWTCKEKQVFAASTLERTVFLASRADMPRMPPPAAKDIRGPVGKKQLNFNV
jgi:hypothetical protein